MYSNAFAERIKYYWYIFVEGVDLLRYNCENN